MVIKQGDVVKVCFNPQLGHEQAGFRPAVVVNNRLLNQDKIVLAFLCPVTHTDRHNPFHYKLDGYDFVDGFVMCDQIKAMDLTAREYRLAGHLREQDISQIVERVEMLIEKE